MKKIREKLNKKLPTLGKNVNLKSKKHLGLIFFLIFYNLVLIYVLFTKEVSIFSSNAALNPPQAESKPQALNYDQLVNSGQIKPIGKILQINLVYNASSSPTLAIQKIEKKNGYVPQQIPVQSEYKLLIVDKNNNTIYARSFEIPNKINGAPPPPGEKARGKIKELPYTEFALNFPYSPNADAIKIYKSSRVIITRKITASISNFENKPNFKTIPGKEFKQPKTQGFLDKLRNLLSQPSQAASSNNYLDIAIISTQYTNMDSFHDDVNSIINDVFTYYEPISTRRSQILFHYIDNTAPLGCYFDSSGLWAWVCNNSLVVQQVNNSAAPWDYIYVLINSNDYGGTGGGYIAVGNNGYSKGPLFAHELIGHAFGGLMDEYTYGYNSPIVAPLDNRVHGGNCYAGIPPAPEWQGIVNSSDYNLGCTYANWYRSSPTSIMYSPSYKFFNKVSQKILNNRLDAVAGPFTGPTLTPIPTPTPSPTPSSPWGPTPEYIYCSKEGEICTLPGEANTAFGSNGKYIYTGIRHNGPFTCSFWVPDGYFPPNTVKYCFYKLLAPIPTSTPTTAPTVTPTPTLAPNIDSDGDGYSNAIEIYLGTNPNKACITNTTTEVDNTNISRPSKTWPADLNTMAGALPSFNKIDIQDITSFLAPIRYLDTSTSSAKFNKRWDLNADGKIDIVDLTSLTTLKPPMLDGTKAFNGPLCPL